MSSTLLRLYQSLPAPLRSLAASAHGQRLRAWRYGPETESLAAEAIEREQWEPQRWQQWQEERLARILHIAATRVPYYRQAWEARRRKGDRASWEVLENWPILEKEALRANPLAFVADGCDPRRMLHEHTSGTTGKPLDLWSTRDTTRRWYALMEARWRGWYGVSRHDRWAILGGQLVVPVKQRRPPFWVWNRAMNQLYLSTYHLAPELVAHHLEALRRYRVRYLWGYTSALFALAQEALRLEWQAPPLAVVIANAEPVFDYQREAITRAFQCPLQETYGTCEQVVAASECPFGTLHLWPEVGYLEVLDGDRPVADGTPGDLICTSLLNAEMPLIRYRLGDRVVRPAQPAPCACGRRLPELQSVDGRTDDLLYTADGVPMGTALLSVVFQAQLPVREVQLVQEALDQIRVRYVPAPGFDRNTGLALVERLQERLGKMEVILDAVESLPRDANGKFRSVVCRVPPATLAAVKARASNG